ncbi:MAG: ABC transporter permease [Planctomycetota bacterium]
MSAPLPSKDSRPRSLESWEARAAPLAVFLLFLLTWQSVVSLWGLPKAVLPSPLQVADAGWENRGLLLKGLYATGKAAVLGLSGSVLIGTLLAILFSQSRWLRISLYPYIIFLQTVPIVAIAPLLIIWSGNNLRTIVLVAVIISVFPIVANVTSGLLSLDRNWRDLFQLNGAGRWQTLWKLQLPAAVRFLVIGTRIASGLAVIGAIIGEFFVGNGTAYDGLGTLMTQWQTRQKTDALIAAVGASTLLGVGFFLAVNLVSGTLLRRWTRTVDFEAAG